MTHDEQVVLAIREEIAKRSEEDRIRIECIARALRNVLEGGGEHAGLAFALVGAEMAAKP